MQNNDYARHKQNNMNERQRNSECGKKGKNILKTQQTNINTTFNTKLKTNKRLKGNFNKT